VGVQSGIQGTLLQIYWVFFIEGNLKNSARKSPRCSRIESNFWIKLSTYLKTSGLGCVAQLYLAALKPPVLGFRIDF
jgi:hypothetical protein